MTLADRLRAGVSAFLQRSPKVSPGKPGDSYLGMAGGSTGSKWDLVGTRKGALTLRRFSERNVWVRVAINRRKRELAGAKWKIVRLDDPKAQPDTSIVDEITELFTFVNDTKASLSWLLSILIEDILTFDAGVVEKEREAGGKLAALWPIDGSEIMPINGWDGSNPKRPRYVQWRQGIKIAEYLNDELVYMMANPRSNSPIGLSPLEVLVATVEADLYGEQLEYQMLKETAPAGILYLGSGVPADKVEAYRTQWEADVAGTREIAFIGGGGYDPMTGKAAEPPEFIPFHRSSREEERRDYMKWLATKVAAAFDMDLMAFNLSEAVHRSIGENLQAKTDEGLVGLAGTIESYITREILWDIDPSRKHGFAFDGLIPNNELVRAKIRQIYNAIGYTFPNELRAEDGKDPVEWGEIPFPVAQARNAMDPAEGESEQTADGAQSKPAKNKDEK